MEKLKELWDSLPKTAKVFFYIAISYVLSEGLIELGHFEQTFLVRVSAQIINLIIVFLQEAVPEIKKRLEE